MNSALKKNLLIHGLTILGFLFITVLIHYPTFLGGKHIDQHDISQAIGGNHQLQEYRAEAGEEPLWNPNVFSGMPAYLTGVRFSGDLLDYVYQIIKLGMSHPESILFTSMVSFYILLLSFKVRPLLAAAGAIAFGLNGFNIIGIMAGHNSKIAAVALAPLVLAGVHLTFYGKRWLGFGLTALALGLEIKVNHPQITYYLAIIIAAYGINVLVQVLRNKNFGKFGINSALLVVAALLAVGANFGRLAITLEYSKYTIRGKSELSSERKASSGLDKEYAFRYSNGIIEPLFLFIPNFFGGSLQQELSPKSAVADALKQAGYDRSTIARQIKSLPTYWGNQPLTAPYYAGTLTVLFFILGIVLLKKEEKIWLILLVALGIVMSWGKNFDVFNNFLFDYLPGYNKFRSVTFTIIISIFAMNLLGFQALERLLSTKWDKNVRNKVFLTFGIGGGFLLILLLFSGVLGYQGPRDSQLPEWLINALQTDRQSLLKKDTLRAILFVALFGAFLWVMVKGGKTAETTHRRAINHKSEQAENQNYAYPEADEQGNKDKHQGHTLLKEKVRGNQLLLVLIFIVLIDSFSLTRRFLGKEKFSKDPLEEFFKITPIDQLLLTATQPGDRVLNVRNPFNENRTSYYHASIGGYHGAKIRRYQDLIDYCIGSELQTARKKLSSHPIDFSDLPILNMLNTKYLVDASNQQNPVVPNPSANGSSWTVSEIIPVNSPDEEIQNLCSINTKTQATLDKSKFEIPSISGIGSINLIEKTPNKLHYSSAISDGTALGVFSEIYYPEGWIASIDGNEAEILRVNYVLRALTIPKGNHEIIFEFKPKTYYTGNTIMIISSILVILCFVVGIANHIIFLSKT